MASIFSHAGREAAALLILRFGLAWFMFVWAMNKFFAPKQYQSLAKWFDKVDLEFWQIYAVASIQVVVCLLVFAGAFRVWSYGALAIMHAYTVYRQLPVFLDPFAISEKGFPVNRNATVSLAVMAALIALWLLRHRDRWSVDGFRGR